VLVLKPFPLVNRTMFAFENAALSAVAKSSVKLVGSVATPAALPKVPKFGTFFFPLVPIPPLVDPPPPPKKNLIIQSHLLPRPRLQHSWATLPSTSTRRRRPRSLASPCPRRACSAPSTQVHPCSSAPCRPRPSATAAPLQLPPRRTLSRPLPVLSRPRPPR